MSSQKNLEITGNIVDHPLAELLVEIQHLRLNGSLRLANSEKKIIVYFVSGEVVFAVSNLRQHRLFELLLREEIVSKQQLLSIPNFTDDRTLSKNLIDNNVLRQTDITALVNVQLSEILNFAFEWLEGTWVFNPHIRIKETLEFKISLPPMLIEYARNQSSVKVISRFKSLKEMFSVKAAIPASVNLLPQEAFVLSRLENSVLTIEQISALSGIDEASTLKTLYTLWLAGFIVRQHWNTAFSEQKTSAILTASFTLKKVEKIIETKPIILPAENSEDDLLEIPAEETATVDAKLSLDDYLQRIENATNFYEVLAIDSDADTARIKQSYFNLAKQFHPDLFYKKTDAELFRRIQNAFTEFAQAYETLKTDSSRELYDYRMRKEIAEMESIEALNLSEEESDLQKQANKAAENFEQGFNHLMDQEIEDALPYLARAAHLAPDNARYHAYHGKALSFNITQRHKAEGELQLAIRLDSENADFRIMLVEFFIQMGLLKRAEGELNRMLAAFPDHKEAKVLLDNLAKG